VSLLTDKLPNKALQGDEVKAIAIKEFAAMLDRDYSFNRGVTYRRVGMKLEATFQFSQPHPTSHKIESRPVRDGDSNLIVEGVPLDPPEEESTVAGLERQVLLNNANLDRIQHDLPIRLQERQSPKPLNMTPSLPGEPPNFVTDPFPGFEARELNYDREQFPPAPPPVDIDTSEQKAGALGLKPRGKVTQQERGKGAK